MTEKELISKIQGLKQIKPRKEWVVLSKMNILGIENVAKKEVLQSAHRANFFPTSDGTPTAVGATLLGFIFNRKLAYAFAVLLFVFVGVAGVLKYETVNAPKVASSKSTAQLLAVNTIKDNVQELKAKYEILADVVKNDPQNSEVAIKEAKVAAQNLTDNIQKNPELAKTIALEVNNNKTILNIPGGNEVTDLKKTLNSPYKALVEQLIKDEQKMTLSSDQKMVLDNVIKLHNEGNDSDALVNAVLLVNSTDTKDEDGKTVSKDAQE